MYTRKFTCIFAEIIIIVQRRINFIEVSEDRVALFSENHDIHLPRDAMNI